ncbi:MAG TPA: Crp/Fnr family transcriptional regulator [Bacteroidaceae bacterium]|nr:Crp/Fnr family transcriptional regulator [Bacteroidaceae bacterium]
MDLTMYDILLQLPLFQGMSNAEFTNLLNKVKFHFTKHVKGEKIIKAGEKCEQFVFVINGDVISERFSHSVEFSFIETLCAPVLIEPYSIFGFNPAFTSNYIAKTDVSILRIEKNYIYSELGKFNIFIMNLLNAISYRAQTQGDKIWNHPVLPLKERIIKFVVDLSEVQFGEKSLKIKMEDLAQIMNETRLSVSKTLNELESENKIILKRKEIIFPSIENLIS